MNESNKNIKLIKSIVDTDFCLVNTNHSVNSSSINYNLKINSNSSVSVLELFELNKNVKQFVRLLQFLNLNKKSHLYIVTEDKYLFLFISKLFKDVQSKVSLKIKMTLPTEKESFDEPQFIILLGDISHKFANIIKKKFVDNNILLVSKINLNVERNLLGSYKMYNDLNDMKKILFLVVILIKILKIEKIDA